MRYVGRHRAPRPMYVRHPLVGGVATAVLLGVPALAVAAGTLPQGQPSIPGAQVPVPTSSYGGLSETEPRSVLAAVTTSTGPGGSRKSTTTLRTATRTVPDGRVSLLPEPDGSAAGTERARRTSTSTAPTVGAATPTSTTTSTTTTSTISPVPVPTPTPTPTPQPVAPTPTETPTATPTGEGATTPPVTPTAEPTPDSTTTSSTSPVSTP